MEQNVLIGLLALVLIDGGLLYLLMDLSYKLKRLEEINRYQIKYLYKELEITKKWTASLWDKLIEMESQED